MQPSELVVQPPRALGIGQEGDNPYFVNAMANWMSGNLVIYNDYWNTNAAYPGMISTGQYPNAAQQFLALKP